VDVPTKDIYASVNRLLAILALVSPPRVALSVAIAIAVARSIARPVRLAAEEFRALASGDADLTKRCRFSPTTNWGNSSSISTSSSPNSASWFRDSRKPRRVWPPSGKSSAQRPEQRRRREQIGERAAQMRVHAKTQRDSVVESAGSVEQVARTIANLAASSPTRPRPSPRLRPPSNR
jgi:methyl-accepting chemotaxis protein